MIQGSAHEQDANGAKNRNCSWYRQDGGVTLQSGRQQVVSLRLVSLNHVSSLFLPLPDACLAFKLQLLKLTELFLE